MASNTWGLSWGGTEGSWGLSWGDFGGAPPPPPSPVSVVTPSGGYHAQELRDALEGRKSWRQKLKEQRIQAAAIDAIEHIAVRQAASLELDKQKRFEELERELQIRGVEWDTKYFNLLNQRRETLIHEEIGRLIWKGIREEEEITILLMMLAVLN